MFLPLRVSNLSRVVLTGAVLLGFGLPMLPAFGQQPLQTLLVGVDRRTVTSLDGDWHFLVDAPPAGALYTGNGQINDHSYALNTHPNLVGRHNLEYEFATAPTIGVPGDWNTQVPQLFNFEGVVWYQRDFDAQPQPGTRTFLHIGAANYRSHVWVNQKRVCDHEGGYASNDYTDLLKANGIHISMSRKGNPWDNAACESFMKTLKYEEVLRNEYRDLAEAFASIPEFLEKVYNQKRLHSALGYLPPVEFEAQLATQKMEAAARQLVA